MIPDAGLREDIGKMLSGRELNGNWIDVEL